MNMIKRLSISLAALLLAVGMLSGCNVGAVAGKDGKDGSNGLSAYEIAVKNGFVGSEQEWLESLKGETGKKGTEGLDGKSAYELARKNGYDGTLEGWLASLKGEQGEQGEKGVGIARIEAVNGYLIVTYTDGTIQNIPITTSSLSPSPTGSATDSVPSSVSMNSRELVLRSFVRSENTESFQARYDGDLINNAVYNVKTSVEDRLNCTVRVQEKVVSGLNDDIFNEIEALAGDIGYHLIAGGVSQMVDLTASGLLTDLTKQPYINLNNLYYDAAYNDALRVGDRQYLATGKTTYSWYRYQSVTFFNRNLFKAKQVEYPYNLVKEGDGAVGGWTMAKMYETSCRFYEDLNDNGYDLEDQYGYFIHIGSTSSHPEGYMAALGIRMIEKDENGYYAVASHSKADWIEAVEAYVDVIASPGSFASPNISSQTVRDKFCNGGAAMINLRLYHSESENMLGASRYGEGYGVLPLAKANDEQLNYYGYIADQVLAFGIPYELTDAQKQDASILLEVYSSTAYGIVPETYEVKARKRNTPDVPSVEMFEIIRKNIVVDPLNVYGDDIFPLTTKGMMEVYWGTKTSEQKYREIMEIEEGNLQQVTAALNYVYRLWDANFSMVEESGIDINLG